MGDNDGNRRRLSIGIPCLLLVLSWTTVALRVWVKKWVVNAFSLDDWFMVVGMVLFTAFIALDLKMVLSYGLGQHIEDLSGLQIQSFFMFWFIEEVLYLALTILVKLSITILLVRLAERSIYRIVLRTTGVFYTLGAIAFIFVICLQCFPITYLWAKNISGNCMDTKITTNVMIYLQAGVGIGTDFLFALLPIAMIWNIPMDIRTKISVSIILGLGIFSSVANTVRFAYLDDAAADVTYASYSVSMWTHIEVSGGIIAASLVTLNPLLRRAAKVAGCNPLSSTSGDRLNTPEIREIRSKNPVGSQKSREKSITQTDVEKAYEVQSPKTVYSPKMTSKVIAYSRASKASRGSTSTTSTDLNLSTQFSTFNIEEDAKLWDEACKRARNMARANSCDVWDKSSLNGNWKAEQKRAARPLLNRNVDYHISEEIDLPTYAGGDAPCDEDSSEGNSGSSSKGSHFVSTAENEGIKQLNAIFGPENVIVDRRHSD